MVEISRWTMLHGRVDRLKLIAIKSRQYDSNQYYTMQKIADILKIPEYIKLLVQMKNVSFILLKKPYGLFGQPNIFKEHSTCGHLFLISNENFACVLIFYTSPLVTVLCPRPLNLPA